MMRRFNVHIMLLSLSLWTGLVEASTANAPDNGFLVLIVKAVATMIVLSVFIYCVKCFVRPGESSKTHIKRRILQDSRQENRHE